MTKENIREILIEKNIKRAFLQEKINEGKKKLDNDKKKTDKDKKSNREKEE